MNMQQLKRKVRQETAERVGEVFAMQRQAYNAMPLWRRAIHAWRLLTGRL